MGKVRLPVYVVDNEGTPHLLYVWIEILNQSRLPLLLGSKSLHKVNSTLSFGEQTLTLDWKGERLCLPISQENSGHFHLQFSPMPQVEDNHFTEEMVSKANWSRKRTEIVQTRIAPEKKPLGKQQVTQSRQLLDHNFPKKVKGH